MAVMRERPYGNANFLVDLGDGDVHSAWAGFAEIVFPTFVAGSSGTQDGDLTHVPAVPAAGGGSGCVTLRRGVTGALNLYAWWNKARRGKAPQRRTVKIELLSEDQSTVVLTWRLRNARPVSISYSPLRASDGGVLMETIELAFDGMEMS